ncbi:cytochrome o ubiquinol oxidase subunit IV [Sphingomonas sp.]|uniref:cytochrome o ubiquinol oxidase subunit IV n=1 Tax=Sphingomonas sp. TaxID=28214 RepID=UPI003B004AAA
MSSNHHSASEHSRHDLAPGEEQKGGSGIAKGVRGYLVGLAFAAGLTVASFVVAGSTRFIYAPGVPVALLVLAVAQMGVHLAFFLHITTGPDNTNNVLALAFGTLIVALVVVGSLWIMANLNANMMPMDAMMPAGGMAQSGPTGGATVPGASPSPVTPPPAAR